MTQAQIEPSELARRIVDVLSDRQAEDIVMLDISQVASFTDYFVIATAQNPRHMNALIDAFDRELAREGIKALHIEGGAGSAWVLVDLGGGDRPPLPAGGPAILQPGRSVDARRRLRGALPVSRE